MGIISLYCITRMAENKDDSSVSLDDVLANEEEMREAISVLAGSDPENCSYSQGYVKRQAVFACSTCTPRGAEPAGLCLACTNKCHDGHDIFELYTKRNFRCDCGNAMFGNFQCRLIPTKDSQNTKNQYNHNFHGKYCSCDRPYPDTEDQANDEMIQCVVCEDWFHTRHLGCTVVESEDLQEMVCETCMHKAPFLWTYAAHCAVPLVVKVSRCKEELEVNVEEGEKKSQKCAPCGTSAGEGSSSTGLSCQEPEKEATSRSSPCKRTRQEMTGSPVKSRSEAVVASCRLKELQGQGLERAREGAVFWPYDWRSKLCTCVSCKRAYVEVGVQFLMDESDTILAYENRGRSDMFFEGHLMSFLSSMDRVQQLELIYHYEDLKTELTAFLGQFATEGKVVTVEAVQEFFEELRSKKVRRTNAGYQ